MKGLKYKIQGVSQLPNYSPEQIKKMYDTVRSEFKKKGVKLKNTKKAIE